jgi:type I protein arginine methyltransferase
MSLHLSPSDIHESGDDSESQHGSEEEDDDDQTWDDFAEDSIAQQPCFSLFEDKKFPSVTEALENDRSKHGFDLDQTCIRLGRLWPFMAFTLCLTSHDQLSMSISASV